MPVSVLRDPVRLDTAYAEHGPAMLAAANRVLHDRAASEDVVQDVFLALWRRPESYDPRRGSLAGYLTMMARSRALDRWRTRSARDAALQRSAAQAQLERPLAEDAAEPVIRRDGRQRLLGVLDGLPRDQRDAVLLAFARDLNAREIAAVTKVPLGTAKSRIRLGLQKARAELAAAA